MDRNEIILRISQIRTKAGLSARQLSNLIDMNDGYINRLESKKDFLPSVEVLINIISACGCTPAQFFYNDIDTYKGDMQILDIVKGADTETRQVINDIFTTINKAGAN